MSYAGDCRTRFSPEQIADMQIWANSSNMDLFRTDISPNASKMSFSHPSSYKFQNGLWNVLAVNYNGQVSIDDWTWEWVVPSSAVQHTQPNHSYINFQPNTNASSIYIQARACNCKGNCSSWRGSWFQVEQSDTPCGGSSAPCLNDEVHY